MTLAQAQMIVRNRESYSPQLAYQAAIFVLASIDATPEDAMDATACLDNPQRDRALPTN